MGKGACAFLVAVVLWTTAAHAQTAPVEGPTLWVRGVEAFVPLRQTDFTDLDLYVAEDWAKTTYLGIPRYAVTCLATVYAMVEHARGNTGYRVGQAGTWTDATGAEPYERETGRGIAPSMALISAELTNGNPVILQGYSDALNDRHFMLAIGLTAAGNIVALDPLTGTEVEIDGPSLSVALATAEGASLQYSIESLRTIDFSPGGQAEREDTPPPPPPVASDATPASQRPSMPAETDPDCAGSDLAVGLGEVRCGVGLSTDGRILLDGQGVSEPLVTGEIVGPEGTRQLTPHELHLYPPSPDGRYRVIVACDEMFCANVWILDLDARSARQTSAGHYGPRRERIWWSPDGSHAAFAYGGEGFDWLYVVRMADGFSQELFNENMLLSYATLTWQRPNVLRIDGFQCDRRGIDDPDYCRQQSFRHGFRTVSVWIDAANIGLTGSQVAEAQRLLARLGYDPGPVDGAFGHRTLGAIDVFLLDRGIARDATSMVLLEELRAAAGRTGTVAEEDPIDAAAPVAVERDPDRSLTDPNDLTWPAFDGVYVLTNDDEFIEISPLRVWMGWQARGDWHDWAWIRRDVDNAIDLDLPLSDFRGLFFNGRIGLVHDADGYPRYTGFFYDLRVDNQPYYGPPGSGDGVADDFRIVHVSNRATYMEPRYGPQRTGLYGYWRSLGQEAEVYAFHLIAR